ncbi:hypothetical protein KKA14_04680 [bacterium]|nr:hypothetical protein [bacterium]
MAIQITDPIIHGVILGKSYSALQHVWRPDMMSKMWIMFINSFMFAILFVYIFSKGHEGKGILEGVRYGVITGFFVYIFSIINQYVVYPISFMLVFQWGVFGMIQFIIFGIVTALIYKPKLNS